jgi:hypothetical protein
VQQKQHGGDQAAHLLQVSPAQLRNDWLKHAVHTLVPAPRQPSPHVGAEEGLRLLRRAPLAQSAWGVAEGDPGPQSSKWFRRTHAPSSGGGAMPHASATSAAELMTPLCEAAPHLCQNVCGPCKASLHLKQLQLRRTRVDAYAAPAVPAPSRKAHNLFCKSVAAAICSRGSTAAPRGAQGSTAPTQAELQVTQFVKKIALPRL